MCDLDDCEKSADVGAGRATEGPGNYSENRGSDLDDDFKGLLVHG